MGVIMSILSGVSAFFGLDIGTTAIRLVELQGNGQPRSLVKYAYLPIDSKIVLSDAKTDQQRLAQAIGELMSRSHMLTRNVAVGVPSQRVFTTLADFDRLPNDELAKSIKYQADSLIPTPLDESKLDWEVLGDSPKDPTKLEILLSSVPNAFIEQRLDMLEGIGLNVIAFEPDNLAMARAMLPTNTKMPQLVLDVGYKSADLVIIVNGTPKLTRSIPTGVEAIVRSATQNLNVDETQAQQFVFKFGLSKDKLEGQVYQAILPAIDLLTNEVEKSIKFFQTRYGTAPIERLIITGGAAALPEFPLHVANRFNLNVEIGNAWRNIAFAPERQNELLTLANQFGVAAGLAERQE
jgi:type IV pilus assembly protein PilM